MLSIAYYFLQVTLCSAVMMLYYALVLRNKRFHQYNRFYLLGVAILPWLMPLVKIEINKPQEAVSIPIQLFSVIADTNSEFEKTVADTGFQFTWETLVATLYIAVSGVLLTMLLVAMVKIYKLLKTNSCRNLDDVYLVLTQANGTPFSFFKFIFWHTDIDVTTTAGKQMLQHELTHVKEKHSLDKLLLQIVLIIGWANPIFWLLKRELETIHEFIADNKAIDNGDTAALATMLLAAAYPQQRFALTNPFFYSPIKRRIAMLTNNKHPRFSYARRLVVLPLLVAVTLLFAFRKKEATPITISVASALENVVSAIASPANDIIDVANTNAKLAKTYTVVIDAGHGGTDAGAPGIDGKSFEKDIALSIAKLVKAQNINANINIVLTRDNDVFMSPVQKVDIANKANPDLFVSLHCNNKASMNMLSGNQTQSTLEGIEIFIANKEKALNYNANYEFASALSSGLISSLNSDKRIRTRKQGIWVLQTVHCPSALVECGYMDSKADLQNLTNPSYQQEIATNILKGIETYLVNKEKGVSAALVDTVPVKKVVIVDSNKLITLTGKSTTLKGKLLNDTVSIKTKNSALDSVLIIVAGKKIASIEMDKLNPSDIKSVNILKGKSAADKYGEEGKNGVIEIELKKSEQPFNYKKNGTIKGNYELSKYKSKIKYGRALSGKEAIDKYGEGAKNGVIEVEMNGNDAGKSEDPVVVAIRNDGTKPLYIINGKRVLDYDLKIVNANSIKSINVFKDKQATDKYGEKGKNGVVEIELKKEGDVLDDNLKKEGHALNNDKVFSEVQTPAEFPGGVMAWKKYLERNLRIPEEAKTKNAPAGKYSVEVAFTVHEDGFISNVKALTDPGYGTADAAISLIKKGPKWQPAMQNGIKVTSIKKLSIAFVIDEEAKSISSK